MQWGCIFTVILFAIMGVISLFMGKCPQPPPDTGTSKPPVVISTGVTSYQDVQPPYTAYFKGPRLNLNNNGYAKIPTWQQLMNFVENDTTDRNAYSFEHPCGVYAEEVHNKAESFGIRAAWVFIGLDSGDHACNAFDTTDKGLTFIDCTRQQFIISRMPSSATGLTYYGDPTTYDKVVYCEIGKEYGQIDLGYTNSPYYSAYVQQRQKISQFKQFQANYNSECETYNAWVAGLGTYTSNANVYKSQQWEYELKNKEAQMKRMSSELGGFWDPLGIVNKIEIYW